jgi:hypothetical protein
MSVSKDYTLTPEQESKMLNFWRQDPLVPPALDKLTQHVFDNPELDGRSNEGKAIKRALAKHHLQVTTKTKYAPVSGITDLTEEQKEFIRGNANTMNSIELAQELMGDTKGRPFNGNDAEVRLIKEFIKTLDTRARVVSDDHIPSGLYRPPKRLEEALTRVNKYIDYVGDFRALNAGQKRNLNALIGYLHTHRFARQINSYDSVDDRNSMEDAFIRYTYDKYDLTQEEVDEYIVLATEVVMGFTIQRRSEALQRQLDSITNNDPEHARISMSLVEAIGKAQGEYNQCVQRQQKLLQSLKQKRSDRLSKQMSDNASILNLIELWRQEESRQDMLKIAAKEQEEVSEEVERLKNMSDIKARILGLSEEEAKFL